MAALQPVDMTTAQLNAALLRLSIERVTTAGPQRRKIIVGVCDVILDEINSRKAVAA